MSDIFIKYLHSYMYPDFFENSGTGILTIWLRKVLWTHVGFLLGDKLGSYCFYNASSNVKCKRTK